jgi:hypothetical protein
VHGAHETSDADIASHRIASHRIASHRIATARHGTARHGTARHGTARHGTARHGIALHRTASHSTATARQRARGRATVRFAHLLDEELRLLISLLQRLLQRRQPGLVRLVRHALSELPLSQLLRLHQLAANEERRLVSHRRQRVLEDSALPQPLDLLDLSATRGEVFAWPHSATTDADREQHSDRERGTGTLRDAPPRPTPHGETPTRPPAHTCFQVGESEDLRRGLRHRQHVLRRVRVCLRLALAVHRLDGDGATAVRHNDTVLICLLAQLLSGCAVKAVRGSLRSAQALSLQHTARQDRGHSVSTPARTQAPRHATLLTLLAEQR